MGKVEFLAILRRRLGQLPDAEIEKNIEYYSELIDDMIEDGSTEFEAVEKLGNPAALGEKLLSEMPLSMLMRSRVRRGRGLNALTVILLILGSPIWLSIGLALFGVAIAVFVVFWVIVAAVFALVLAAVAAVPILPVLAIKTFSVSTALSVMLLGGAFVCAGIALLVGVLAVLLCKAMARLSVKLFKRIKSLFIKKEKCDE